MKKFLLFGVIAATLAFGSVSTVNAQSPTIEELQAQIAALLTHIQQLQVQLITIQGGGQTPAFCHTFQDSLRLGDSGAEVRGLQEALREEGLYAGNITGDFDTATFQAVVAFQEKYQQEVLAPFDITRGTGFVGRTTKAQLNKLYGCGTQPPLPSPPTTIPTPPPPTGEPFITVISPNGGEQIVLGQTYDIRWAAQNVGGTVRIWVCRAAATTFASCLSVGGAEASAGVFSWNTQGIDVLYASGEPLKVSVVSSFAVFDESDGYFTISDDSTAPFVTVTSPNGGEQLIVGKTYEISWRATQADPVGVAVYLSDQRISPWKETQIAKGVNPESGRYSWTIPSDMPVGTRYKIHVTGIVRGATQPYQGSVGLSDFSDDYFSIVAVDVVPPARSNGNPVGALQAGTTQATLGLDTDEEASCRYATSSGVPYDGMANVFGIGGGGGGGGSDGSSTSFFVHQATVTGLSDGNIYRYYVRCKDTAGNTNTLDFPIEFSVDDPQLPSVDLKVNGSDGPVTIAAEGSATLSWESTNATSCTASVGGPYDLNGDGFVNMLDIGLYTASNPTSTVENDQFLNGMTNAFGTIGWSYDLDGSGVVNILDISRFQRYNPDAASSKFFNDMQGAFGTMWGPYDLDGDGFITIDDIGRFKARNPGVQNAFLDELVARFGQTVQDSWTGSKTLSGTQSTGAVPVGITYVIMCEGSNGSAADQVGVIIPNTSVEAGAVTVSIDSTSPASSTAMLRGSSDQVLGAFRVAADNTEGFDLDSAAFKVENGNQLASVSLYHGSKKIGVLDAIPSAPEQFRFGVNNGDVTIPQSSRIVLTLKADIPQAPQADSRIQANLTELVATGLVSGQAVVVGDSPAAKHHYIFSAFPSAAANTSTPSGDLILSSATTVAVFDITNTGSERLTFEQKEGNRFVVNLNAFVNDADGNLETFALKDASGNTLDTATADAAVSGEIEFDFGSSPFTVHPGTTERWYIYADITEFEDDGDTIQIYLDDNDAENFCWGINGAGKTCRADVVFRGDIYAGILANPS